MNINNLSQLGAYRAQVDTGSTKKSAEAGANRSVQANNTATTQAMGDKVSVSADAMLRTEAYRQASSAPDVRQDKVNDIKERIAAGSYKVDSRNIASKLVQSDLALFNK